MAIKGSLKEASLPDVIQLLFLGRRTGCLALADRHNFGTIYLDEGQITFATIVNRRDRLGDLLIRKGRITAEQLEKAIAAQEDDRQHKLGEILVGTRYPHPRRAGGLHASPDRGGGLLSVHLDLGNLQLRGRCAGPRAKTFSSASAPRPCCWKVPGGWMSGVSSRRKFLPSI